MTSVTIDKHKTITIIKQKRDAVAYTVIFCLELTKFYIPGSRIILVSGQHKKISRVKDLTSNTSDIFKIQPLIFNLTNIIYFTYIEKTTFSQKMIKLFHNSPKNCFTTHNW